MMRATTQIRSIECKLLFDGEDLVEDAVITVEGGRITDVRPGRGAPAGSAGGPAPGKGGEVAPREGEALRAPFVMPGLIDSHVHCTGYIEGMPAGAPFEPVKAFLRLCIYSGVTTVRDTGNALETLFYVRDWSSQYAAPRAFGSGPILDVPPLTWAFSRIVRDEASVRREVGRLADDGVDLIKAYRNVDPPLLASIVEVAGERGLPVAVDSQRTPSEEASRLGARSLEHLQNLLFSLAPAGDGEVAGDMVARLGMLADLDLSSAACERMVETLAQHGTFVVPTLLVSRRRTLLEEMINEPMLDFMVPVMPYHRHFRSMRSPVGLAIGRRFMARYMPIRSLSRDDRRTIERGFARMEELLARLHEAGVPIAAGTDSPNPSLVPGFSLHQELGRMVHAGVPPLAVLRSATSRAAELLGRPDLGRLQPGAVADMLLLDSNPLDDMAKLGHIRAVMRDGQRIDRDEVRRRIDKAIEQAIDGGIRGA